MSRCKFFIPELWERKSTNIVWMLTTGYHALLALIWWIKSHNSGMKNWNFTKSIQTIRLSIPLTMRSLKWIYYLWHNSVSEIILPYMHLLKFDITKNKSTCCAFTFWIPSYPNIPSWYITKIYSVNKAI
jgi:hypothetical protein